MTPKAHATKEKEIGHQSAKLLCFKEHHQEREKRTSLVAQWLRIHLPMQGTRVQALVREDPTWHRATKPMRHGY